jgi:hypothetical protein
VPEGTQGRTNTTRKGRAVKDSSTQTYVEDFPVILAEKCRSGSECPKLGPLDKMHGNSLTRSSTFRASLERAADDINSKYRLSQLPSSCDEPVPLSGDIPNCPATTLKRRSKPSPKPSRITFTVPQKPKKESREEDDESSCASEASRSEVSEEIVTKLGEVPEESHQRCDTVEPNISAQ